MTPFIVYDCNEHRDNSPLVMLDLNVIRCKRGQHVEILHIDDVSPKPKKKLDIYALDRVLFPYDPIRDYIERQVSSIEQRYNWLDEYL